MALRTLVWVIAHCDKHSRRFEISCVCEILKKCLIGISVIYNMEQFACRKQLVSLVFPFQWRCTFIQLLTRESGRKAAWGSVWHILPCKLPGCSRAMPCLVKLLQSCPTLCDPIDSSMPRKCNSANGQPLAEISQAQLSEQHARERERGKYIWVLLYCWVPEPETEHLWFCNKIPKSVISDTYLLGWRWEGAKKGTHTEKDIRYWIREKSHTGPKGK